MTKAGLSGERPAGAALTKPLSSQAHRAGRGWGRGINQFARSAMEATEGLWGDKSHVKVFAKAARQERFHSSPALCLNSKSRPQCAKMQQDTQGGRKPPPEALGNQRGRVWGGVRTLLWQRGSTGLGTHRRVRKATALGTNPIDNL